MGFLSGATNDNTQNKLAVAQGAQNGIMAGSANAYSNYRIANAQARQQALENMMSTYGGANRALASISGGQGATMGGVANNPFNSTPGYFNIGRAYQGASSRPDMGFENMSVDANGNSVGTGIKTYISAPGSAQSRTGQGPIAQQYGTGATGQIYSSPASAGNGMVPGTSPPPQFNPFAGRR